MILNSFGSIFGVIGSIAIITAILITKELQTWMNLITANIALVDFILSKSYYLILRKFICNRTLNENIFIFLVFQFLSNYNQLLVHK